MLRKEHFLRRGTSALKGAMCSSCVDSRNGSSSFHSRPKLRVDQRLVCHAPEDLGHSHRADKRRGASEQLREFLTAAFCEPARYSAHDQRVSRRYGARALQVIEHPLAMRDLSLVEDPRIHGLVVSERQPRQRRPIVHPAHPGAVDLTAVALETEGVVTIRTNFTAIPESGFPLLTRRAQGVPERFRPTAAFAARHGNLQTGSG